MSTGNNLIQTNPDGSGNYQFVHGRTWSGGDGRYTTDASGRRSPKWNPYTCTIEVDELDTLKVGYPWIVMMGTSPAGWTSNDDLRVLAKLVTSIRGSDFNLAVTAAESPEFVRMVANDARQLAKAVSHARRGRLADAVEVLFDTYNSHRHYANSSFFHKKHPGAIPFRRPSISAKAFLKQELPQRWLELQYGWLPTINDVYNAATAYEALTAGARRQVIKVSRRRNHFYEGSLSPTLIHCPGHSTFTRRIFAIVTEQLSTRRTLGLMNPLSVAWELIPYSFVADWFIPISTYLDVLNVIPNVQASYYYVDIDRRQTVYSYPVVSDPVNRAYYTGLRGFREYIKYDRYSVAAPSVPLPSFKSFEEAASPLHVANAVALLATAFH